MINDKYAMDAYVDGDLKFSWKQTYSARDWESLTTTRAEAIWRKKYAAVSEELDNYEEQLTSTVRWITGREQLESSFVLLDREDLIKAMNGGAYIVAHDITYTTHVLGIDTRNQIPLRKGAFIRLTSLCAKHDREEGRIVIKVMDNDRNAAAEWPVFISEDESGKKRLFTCSGVLLYGSWAFTPNDVEGIDRFVVSSHGNTLINEGKFGVIGIDENNEEKSVIVDNSAFLESLLDWKEISAIVRSDEVKDGNNTRAEYVITIDKLRVEDIEEDTVIYVPSLGKETHCFRVCSIGQDRMYLCEYSSAWTLRDEFIIRKRMLGDEEMYLCVRSES